MSSMLRVVFTLLFVGVVGLLVTAVFMYPIEIMAAILFFVVLLLIVTIFRWGYLLSGQLVDKIERRWRG